MAKTKAEIRAFLNSQVGKSVNAKTGVYQGQCVSLIKALLEFVGAPDPYKARGNAKDVGDTLLREGIAKNGKGWLTVVVNRDMGYIGGVRYGHIWADLANEANYEQNGNRALYTTKNTRPISQGQQFVNLDQWIKEDDVKATLNHARIIAHGVGGRNGFDGRPNALAGASDADLKKNHVGREVQDVLNGFYTSTEGKNWREKTLPKVYSERDAYKKQVATLTARVKELEAQGSSGEFVKVTDLYLKKG